MSLHKRTRVNATPSEIWNVVGDPTRYPEFFVGITRWEPIDDAAGRVGDRWWIRMGVGSIEAGGRIRFTEVVPESRLTWETEAGTDHTLTISMEPIDDEHTSLNIDFDLRLMGGLLSRVAEQAAYRIVGRNLKATLHVLRHLVEYEHEHADD